jgi:hypothetical protein
MINSNFLKKWDSPHILLFSLNVTLFSNVLRRNYPCHLFLLPWWLKWSKKKKEKHHCDLLLAPVFLARGFCSTNQRWTLASRAASSLPPPQSVAVASPRLLSSPRTRRPREASRGHPQATARSEPRPPVPAATPQGPAATPATCKREELADRGRIGFLAVWSKRETRLRAKASGKSSAATV